jgi:SAM-dependent methyltransferase
MNPEDATRQIYEQRPYPGIRPDLLKAGRGSLPPVAWMQALGRPGLPLPRRVLVAGCGTGVEAFRIRRMLPRAEMVAFDYSPRSIAVAQRWQKVSPQDRSIHFQVGDLTDPNLARQLGGPFDLISCHGVLTYVPDPVRALRQLATCIQPDGALYLGVNGEGHPSIRVRAWLEHLGQSPATLGNVKQLRAALKVWDALNPEHPVPLAGLSEGYLAGDMCGAYFNNWRLGRWVDVAREAGWSYAGNWLLPKLLRELMEGSLQAPLFPRGWPLLATGLDEARPASFNQLMLRPGNQPEVPWGSAADLADWQFEGTRLYSLRSSRRRAGAKPVAVLACPAFNLRFDWPLEPRWLAAAERMLPRRGQSEAVGLKEWGRTEAARRLLWLWTGLGIVRAVPPGVVRPA